MGLYTLGLPSPVQVNMEKSCSPEHLEIMSQNGSELEKGASMEEMRIESVIEGYVVDAKAERRYVIVC